MKHKVLSLAVLAALSFGGYAHAQTTVQTYGLIDAGVEYLTNADAKGNSVERVVSGGKNTADCSDENVANMYMHALKAVVFTLGQAQQLDEQKHWFLVAALLAQSIYSYQVKGKGRVVLLETSRLRRSALRVMLY